MRSCPSLVVYIELGFALPNILHSVQLLTLLLFIKFDLACTCVQSVWTKIGGGVLGRILFRKLSNAR